jgi:hypothetical protein
MVIFAETNSMRFLLLLTSLLSFMAIAKTPSEYISNNPEIMEENLVKYFNHFHQGRGHIFSVPLDRSEEPINYDVKVSGERCEYEWSSERLLIKSKSTLAKYFIKFGFRPDYTLGSYKIICHASWKKDDRFMGRAQCANNLTQDYIFEHQTCRYTKVHLIYDKDFIPNLYQAAKSWGTGLSRTPQGRTPASMN